MTPGEPDRAPADYVICHIQEALAQDSRTTELGVDVAVSGDRAVLTGTVASAEHRDVIGQVATEVAPDYRVVNEVTVVAYDEAGDAEELT